MSEKVWVIGGANVDLVAHTTVFPGPGETRIGSSFATFFGGKGANQAVAAARLGATVEFVGCVGRDDFGEQITAALAAEGIGTDSLKSHPDHRTGTAIILIDGTGQNEIVVVLGANEHLDMSDLPTCLNPERDWQLVQCEIPPSTVAAVIARAPGRTILNPAPAGPLPPLLCQELFAITPNETETQALTGILPEDECSCRQAAEILRVRGVQHVILTLGSRGVWWQSAESPSGVLVPAPPVTPVDTTAAGDAFNGALAAALARGEAMPQALAWAVQAASISVTRPGAQASMPTYSEIAGGLAMGG